MLAVRGIYDGKTIRVLPTEKLPKVTREVPVAIIFLEDLTDVQRRQLQIEAAQWMRALRAKMPPLDMSLRDMIEEGRER